MNDMIKEFQSKYKPYEARQRQLDEQAEYQWLWDNVLVTEPPEYGETTETVKALDMEKPF